jgi:hypothetical protein
MENAYSKADPRVQRRILGLGAGGVGLTGLGGMAAF